MSRYRNVKRRGGTTEGLALWLFKRCLDQEGRIQSSPPIRNASSLRNLMLDTFADCLDAAKGRHPETTEQKQPAQDSQELLTEDRDLQQIHHGVYRAVLTSQIQIDATPLPNEGGKNPNNEAAGYKRVKTAVVFQDLTPVNQPTHHGVYRAVLQPRLRSRQ